MQQLTSLVVMPGRLTDGLPLVAAPAAAAAAAGGPRPWMEGLAVVMPQLQWLYIICGSDLTPISPYKLAGALQGLAGLQELVLVGGSVDQAWEQPVLGTALPGLTKAS